MEKGIQLSERRRKESPQLTPGQVVDLIVLGRNSKGLRCRVPGTSGEVTLRIAVGDEVPGAIITVKVGRKSPRGPRSGTVSKLRIDAAALGLTPLALRDEGEWDPKEQYWGEEGEPIEERAKPIIARGPRPMYEMEQVFPGSQPDEGPEPIVDALELRDAGRMSEAIDLLEGLLAQDLRCLDAHAHLGNFAFDTFPKLALHHFEVGAAIGALSLPRGFDGVLPWGLIDNRPYLRCLHGLGLCLWWLGKPRKAAELFNRMLWLNPGDNQGVRLELPAIEAGEPWQDFAGDK
ncbi:MAG: hypothetical protein IPJ65_28570 [Archangiaceae bacterium]|nr:hypothetical protein [Archangiaceae bacterium]